MYSAYTYPPIPRPTLSNDNSPQNFEDFYTGISIQSGDYMPGPQNCITTTETPHFPSTSYQTQTVGHISHNMQHTDLSSEWGWSINPHLVSNPRTPFIFPQGYNQAVPTNPTDPHNGYGAETWPGGVGSAPMIRQAPVQLPSHSSLGFGMNYAKIRQAERRKRALDARYVNAAKEITKIMSEAYASRYDSLTIVANDVGTHHAKLDNYIATLDLDVQAWIVSFQSAPLSHRPENSKDKKKNEDYHRLYCCLWCNSTFTVKHNLANYIRSHLDLHISFCNSCDFSSVCSTLPTRHRCST